MAKKVENKEEILEAVENSEEVVENDIEFTFDADEYLSDNADLKMVLKVAGYALGGISAGVGGYYAHKKNVFGELKQKRLDRRYEKALMIVDKYEHPENYIQDESEESDAKPEKKSKKSK